MDRKKLLKLLTQVPISSFLYGYLMQILKMHLIAREILYLLFNFQISIVAMGTFFVNVFFTMFTFRQARYLG